MNFVLERVHVKDKIILNECGKSYTCGRGKENAVVCLSLVVSRHHCVFFHGTDKLYITDLKSANGTFVNGIAQQPYQTIELSENDVIGIGCADITPNDNTMFVYKVCILKTSLAMDSMNDDDLTKTLINNTSHKDSVAGEKRESTIKNCDVVPSKIPRYAETHPNISPEVPNNNINTNILLNNMKTNNLVGATSVANCEDIEDDVQIIHTSFKVKNENAKYNYRSENRLEGNDKLHIDGNTYQHLQESEINLKNNEQMNISFDNDTGNTNSSNDKATISKKSSDNLSGTNNATSVANYMSNDQLVKIKYEEQITDEEENVLYATTSNRLTCDTIPVNIKQEQQTEFAKNDVDQNDRQNEIFPYCHPEPSIICPDLSDIKFENDVKINIKQECVSNDFEKANFLEDVIVLTDSDDEDNPWLHRLSKSQLINEDKSLDTNNVIIKNEIDLGIWKEDEILLKPSEIPSTSKNVNINTNERPNNVSINTNERLDNVSIFEAPACKETAFERESVSDKTTCGSKDDNLLPTKTNVMNLDNIDPSTNEVNSENIDPTNVQEAATRQDAELNQTEVSNVTSSLSNKKQKPVIKSVSVTTTKKLIPVIEPQHMPSRRSRKKQDYAEDKSKHRKIERTAEEMKFTKEDKILRLKEKLHHQFYDKEYGKKHPSSTNQSSLQFLPEKDKKLLLEERRAKLKRIAEEEKKLLLENNQSVKRGTAKPRAKVSQTNRGEFLIHEQIMNVSQVAENKFVEEAHSSKKRIAHTKLTSEPDTSKKSTISDQESKKQKEDISKNAVNDTASLLQQSLHLNNNVNKVQIPKKNNNITNSAVVDNVKEIFNTCNEERHESNKPTSSCSKTLPELQTKSNESASTSALEKESCRLPKPSVTSKKPKKRVSFSNNLTDTKEYEIDSHNTMKRLEGKDAPIPKSKLAQINRAERSPKLEEFLVYIFEWNPIWLEEQRYWQSIDKWPTMTEDLQPMKERYNSFGQYYDVVRPLLLLETWNTISKEFEKKQNVPIICTICPESITQIPIPSTNKFVSEVMFEIPIMKKNYNSSIFPVYGDLVSFEYVGYSDGRETSHKMFGYITQVYYKDVSDLSRYNRDPQNYVQNPHMICTYIMLTRNLERDRIKLNRPQKVRKIFYLRATMRPVQALQYLPQSPLLKMILNPRVEDYQLPNMKPSHTHSSLVTKDKLNTKQMEAVFRVTETVLKKEAKLCLIQGPPGTGKSKVIVNLVAQILHSQGECNPSDSIKILVCAPSNTAIDEIVLRLLAVRSTLKRKFNMVRIGNMESIHPKVKDVSSMELAKRYMRRNTERGVCWSVNTAAEVKTEKKQLQEEIDSLKRQMNNCANMTDIEKRQIDRKLTDRMTKFELLTCGKLFEEMNPEDRDRCLRKSEDYIVEGANVIACTLSSCYCRRMESIFGPKKERLSICIVDEASQSYEAETLIPLLLGVDILILVGDPNQLPATILSQKAKKLKLDRSIFARIQHVFGSLTNNPIIMLNEQYRMTYSISYWPNKYFYDSKLKNAVEYKQTFPFQPYRVLCHASAQNDDKFSNTTEAEFIANMIYAMLTFAKWDDIKEPITLGVLTPYNNQRTIMVNKINEKIQPLPSAIRKRIFFEVNTVDSFQGQERDVIIMSCVRSRGIGFLSDKHRLCVALTRAKHSLIICGNFNTFMKDPMWNALLGDARARGILSNINANATPAVIKPFVIK